ncbi:MAG: HAD-IA family hydrolase [Thermoanaerobaculia bacterium]
MSLPQPRLLVFDWDGTLMDSIGTIVDCTMAAFDCLVECGDVPSADRPPESAIREAIGLGLTETMERHFPAWDEALATRLVEHYRRLWRADFKDRFALFPGSLETVRELHEQGYLLGVATAKGRSGLERELDRSALRPYFHATRTVDEAPSKPAPGMLLGIFDELAVSPGEAVMIGDTSFDLEMARNAGCRGVGVLSGGQRLEHLEPYLPVVVLPSVRELPRWLSGSTGASGASGGALDSRMQPASTAG